jgi:3-deoxy-D-manno-octulosonate 8-phosphate phosphatase (KDO 8-P phosphatase)|tara:strand:- start:392 stop:922 length:531 start_codon:yes stop_codon:yes gene_type:complete
LNIDYKKIKMLISDVDGVWTDGSFYKGPDSFELKKFSVFDGVGMAMARTADLRIALISGRYSPATESRAKELKIKDVYNGTLNKIPAYEELKKKYELDDSSIAYLGDDWIDIPVMNRVAVPIAVENASLEVKNIAIHITKTSGGNGAFREAVEWIIDQQGRKEEIIEMMQKRLLDS